VVCVWGGGAGQGGVIGHRCCEDPAVYKALATYAKRRWETEGVVHASANTTEGRGCEKMKEREKEGRVDTHCACATVQYRRCTTACSLAACVCV